MQENIDVKVRRRPSIPWPIVRHVDSEVEANVEWLEAKCVISYYHIAILRTKANNLKYVMLRLPTADFSNKKPTIGWD